MEATGNDLAIKTLHDSNAVLSNRNNGIVGSLGRVLKIEYDTEDKMWRAVTFVATDANSFQSQLSQYQVGIVRC